MNKFKYPEDEIYLINLYTDGNKVRFRKQFAKRFDFRSPETKRKEFNEMRSKIFKQLLKDQKICQLRLLPKCTVDKHLAIDHYIPLSSNVLNKVIRKIKPKVGKKVPSESYGSNDMSNLVLACNNCNNFKKHRFIKI